MASPADWSPVPTFSASQLLSATAVNRLERDLGILQGINFGLNPAFNGVQAQTGGTRPNEEVFILRSYRIVHRYNELHFRLAARPFHTGSPTQTVACAWITLACPDSTQEVTLTAVCANDPAHWTYASPSTIDLTPYNLQAGSVYVYTVYLQEAQPAGCSMEQVQGRLETLYEQAPLSGSPELPTFTPGAIGAASDLNLLGEALNWLRERVQHPPVFGAEEVAGGGPPEEADRLGTYFFYHTGCTLRYRFGIRAQGDRYEFAGQVSACVFLARPGEAGSKFLDVTCDPSWDYHIVSGSLALAPYGFDDGELYEVYFMLRNPGDPATGPLGEGAPQPELHVHMLYETDFEPPAAWNWRPVRYHRHGETPLAEDYQSLADNLRLLRERIRARNMAVPDVRYHYDGIHFPTFPLTFSFPYPKSTGCPIYLQHRAPWLWYAGSGTLEYAGNTFTLPRPELPLSGSWGILDLTELEWLPFGAFYAVHGASAAFESYFAQLEMECE